MIIDYILGAILILSSLGVILLRKPVHASLSFLLTLLALAALYLQLSAEFIAVMQVLVYAGGIDDIRSSKVADIAQASNLVNAALTDLKAGRAVRTRNSPPYGCSVKYAD